MRGIDLGSGRRMTAEKKRDYLGIQSPCSEDREKPRSNESWLMRTKKMKNMLAFGCFSVEQLQVYLNHLCSEDANMAKRRQQGVP